MVYFLVDKENVYAARENGATLTYYTERSAKTARTRRINSGTLDAKFEVMSREEFDQLDVMVEVKNLMSGRPVQIRKSDRGGCCDPSTERYWTM
jgi:fructose-1,6-bisphosphatase/inositol monophosphatase family enzyme